MDGPESNNAAPLSDELRALDPAAAPPGGDGPAGDGPAPGEGAEAGRDAAMLVAVQVVNLLAAAVASRWPATAYTPGERGAAAAVLAPVFVKHGFTPAWLKKWQEEIAAGAVFAGLAFAGYQRVTAARAAAAAPAPGQDGAAPGAPPPGDAPAS